MARAESTSRSRKGPKGTGDVDALAKIRDLDGDPIMVGFLREVFNYELDQGENALFAYKDLYRSLVSRIVKTPATDSKDEAK